MCIASVFLFHYDAALYNLYTLEKKRNAQAAYIAPKDSKEMVNSLTNPRSYLQQRRHHQICLRLCFRTQVQRNPTLAVLGKCYLVQLLIHCYQVSCVVVKISYQFSMYAGTKQTKWELCSISLELQQQTTPVAQFVCISGGKSYEVIQYQLVMIACIIHYSLSYIMLHFSLFWVTIKAKVLATMAVKRFLRT